MCVSLMKIACWQPSHQAAIMNIRDPVRIRGRGKRIRKR
jgi:hypothetical protein